MIERRSEGAMHRVTAALRPRADAWPAFTEGLLLGAMVGAAIAGSTLWTRWQASRGRARAAPPRDGSPSPPA